LCANDTKRLEREAPTIYPRLRLPPNQAIVFEGISRYLIVSE